MGFKWDPSHPDALGGPEERRKLQRGNASHREAQKGPERPREHYTKSPETPSMDEKTCHELGWLAGELAGWLPHDDSVNKLALHDLGHPGATL